MTTDGYPPESGSADDIIGVRIDPASLPADSDPDRHLRLRPGDQPLPVRNDTIDIQSLVIADITARRELGIRRYGTPLQAGNGRDALKDAYEEAMDLTIYLRQAIAERDQETAP